MRDLLKYNQSRINLYACTGLRIYLFPNCRNTIIIEHPDLMTVLNHSRNYGVK